MKRRMRIVLFAVILLCVALLVGYGYSERLAHQRAQTLAQTIAGALGRTAANSIVEFESCGMFTCYYYVYFSTPDDFAGMNARMLALDMLDKMNLRVTVTVETESAAPLRSVMNYDLDRMDRNRFGQRLTVTSESFYNYTGPSNSYWCLQNEKGENVGHIYLYHTRDKGVTYLFDGKPLPNNNTIRLYTAVHATK